MTTKICLVATKSTEGVDRNSSLINCRKIWRIHCFFPQYPTLILIGLLKMVISLWSIFHPYQDNYFCAIDILHFCFWQNTYPYSLQNYVGKEYDSSVDTIYGYMCCENQNNEIVSETFGNTVKNKSKVNNAKTFDNSIYIKC